MCPNFGADGHNFEMGPPKDHSDKAWLKLAKWFLTRRFLKMIFCLFMPNLHNWSKSAKVLL
jgi:hypothetical protein